MQNLPPNAEDVTADRAPDFTPPSITPEVEGALAEIDSSGWAILESINEALGACAVLKGTDAERAEAFSALGDVARLAKSLHGEVEAVRTALRKKHDDGIGALDRSYVEHFTAKGNTEVRAKDLLAEARFFRETGELLKAKMALDSAWIAAGVLQKLTSSVRAQHHARLLADELHAEELLLAKAVRERCAIADTEAAE